jgi:hypothetical protein
VPLKFRHIPAAGRVIIVACAFAVFAIAAVACATSYNAIYHLVDGLGLYGEWITRLFPALVDVAFLVAESAAILGGIMMAVTRSDEVTRGWAWLTMWLCVAATLVFNGVHAYLIGGRSDPKTIARIVVSLLPPLLMMAAFQVLIAIVKWVMLHLGRPLDSAHALSPTSPPSEFGAWEPGLSSGSAARLDAPGNGHGASMRERVEAHLAALSPQELEATTEGRVHADLRAAGVAVSKTYVGRVLGSWRAARPDKRPR